MTEATESPASRLGAAANVLVLGTGSDVEDETCADLVTDRSGGETNVLAATLDQTPDERADVWWTYVGRDAPSTFAIVSVGETMRSAAASGPATSPATNCPRITPVSNPEDLAELGATLSEFLSAWADNGNRTVLCFHSLTALLRHVSVEEAFRFLHALTETVRRVDGLGHYHLDPVACDRTTVDTLAPLFDTVIDVDAEATGETA